MSLDHHMPPVVCGDETSVSGESYRAAVPTCRKALALGLTNRASTDGGIVRRLSSIL